MIFNRGGVFVCKSVEIDKGGINRLSWVGVGWQTSNIYDIIVVPLELRDVQEFFVSKIINNAFDI